MPPAPRLFFEHAKLHALCFRHGCSPFRSPSREPQNSDAIVDISYYVSYEREGTLMSSMSPLRRQLLAVECGRQSELNIT